MLWRYAVVGLALGAFRFFVLAGRHDDIHRLVDQVNRASLTGGIA